MTVDSLEQTRSLVLDGTVDGGPMTARFADICDELATAVSSLLALQDRLAATDTESLQKLDSFVQAASTLLRLQQQQQQQQNTAGNNRAAATTGVSSSRRRLVTSAARNRRGDSSSPSSGTERERENMLAVSRLLYIGNDVCVSQGKAHSRHSIYIRYHSLLLSLLDANSVDMEEEGEGGSWQPPEVT